MMLQPGCRFVTAPQFQPAADWPQRLLVGAGVDAVDGVFRPRPAWRPPTADELQALLPTAEPAPSVSLFQLPRHLRSAWWDLLAAGGAAPDAGVLPGFDAFVHQVGEFLTFKGLPIPAAARCAVVVTAPAQSCVSWGLPAHPGGGLGCTLPPETPWPTPSSAGRLWGGINLGDEATSLVLVNLAGAQLAAALPQAPATVGAAASGFLQACPCYPLVRLTLHPGEGCRLPSEMLILGGCLEGKQEPDAVLLVAAPGQSR